MTEALRALATAHGVQLAYTDVEGRAQEASVEALHAIVRALGSAIERVEEAPEALRVRRLQAHRVAIPPTLVQWQGQPAAIPLSLPEAALPGQVQISIHLEPPAPGALAHEPPESRHFEQRPDFGRRLEVEGEVRRLALLSLPTDLPIGYHRLSVQVGSEHLEATLLCAPREAHFGPGGEGAREWGAFLPLYALRRQDSLGTGNLLDLEALGRLLARHGGRALGTLPLLSSFLDAPFEPSPYAPVSRRHWNELFVDPRALPEVERCPAAQARLSSQAFGDEAARLRSAELVDYAASAALLRSVLGPLAETAHQEPLLRERLEAFLAEHPQIDDYARFRAATQRAGRAFHGWEEAARGGDLGAAPLDPAAHRYHRYAQWVAHRQLEGVSRRLADAGVDLYLDLPVGVHPDGYDVYRERDLFAQGVSTGAPPDPLFRGGQDWGFPPLLPDALLASGQRYFAECLRHHMRVARRLRLDHVMGLYRLFWVPQGMSAKQGVYVRYPADTFFAALCIESRRAGCALIGENLGTVPPEVNRALEAHRMQGMYVGQFAIRPSSRGALEPPEPGVLASMNTHDTPTFAGFWHGDDVDLCERQGLLDPAAARADRQGRAELRRSLGASLAGLGLIAPPEPGEEAPLEAVFPALLQLLGRSRAALVIVALEDLWGSRLPQNVPGTHREEPNWRRKAALDLESLEAQPELLAILDALHAARGGQDE